MYSASLSNDITTQSSDSTIIEAFENDMDSVLPSMDCDLVTVSGTVAVPRTIDACDCSLDDESPTEPNAQKGLDPQSFVVNRSSVKLTDTELSVLKLTQPTFEQQKKTTDTHMMQTYH